MVIQTKQDQARVAQNIDGDTVKGLNQGVISKVGLVWASLTLKMITAQVVETSLTVNNNSPIQEYVHPDDQTKPTYM